MASAANEDPDDVISAINITPLVDIFLVLLIIFMISSSVIDQKQIDVSLPKAAHAGTEAPKATGLFLDKERRLFLEGRQLDSLAIAGELRRMRADDPEFQVLIGADQDLAYKEVVAVIDLVRGSGVSKYALKVVRTGL